MMQWSSRTHEERALLNPAFCASLVWCAARGCTREGRNAISLEEAFLILPMVLHRGTRQSLPRSTRTSLAVWLDDKPLSRGRIAGRARALVPYTKETLLFAGTHGFIEFDGAKIIAVEEWRNQVRQLVRQSSDEVKDCAKRAEFVGKWFGRSGSATTVLALLGVRP